MSVGRDGPCVVGNGVLLRGILNIIDRCCEPSEI